MIRLLEPTKSCVDCGLELPLNKFYHRHDRPGQYSSRCRVCHNSKTKQDGIRLKERDPQHVRRRDYNRRLLRVFGITYDDFLSMFNAQNGKCYICGIETTETGLVVDHDHNTGSIRKLLCLNCNTGLGQFKDDITRLETAIRYLREHDQTT